MGENRERGGALETHVEAFVNTFDHFRNKPVTGFDAGENRGLALMTMMKKRADIALRLAYRAAVARPVNGLGAPAEFFQRGDILAHRAIGRRDDRGRPAHDMIAGKQ